MLDANRRPQPIVGALVAHDKFVQKGSAPVVIVIDDDEAVRISLKLLLKSAALPTAVYASATEFLSHYVPDQPGCLVVDIHMPGMCGLELQQNLNLLGETIPVIFISAHGDICMAVEAMRHGAFDFIPKPFHDHYFLNRVHCALEKDAANRRSIGQRDHIRERVRLLTPREFEVMTLITKGKPNKVIAEDLGVSQRTVEIHRARVMEKMDAGSLAQLVRMTLEVEQDPKRAFDPAHLN